MHALHTLKHSLCRGIDHLLVCTRADQDQGRNRTKCFWALRCRAV